MEVGDIVTVEGKGFKIIDETTRAGVECWAIKPIDEDGNLVQGLFSTGLIEKEVLEKWVKK